MSTGGHFLVDVVTGYTKQGLARDTRKPLQNNDLFGAEEGTRTPTSLSSQRPERYGVALRKLLGINAISCEAAG